jgi:CxxC motif-containing protein (DUF1111 family)
MKKFILFFSLLGLIACDHTSENPNQRWLEVGEEFAGGATTVEDETENAFGYAAPNLTGNKDLEFVTGNSFFRVNWVTAPSSTEDLDGLGPLFNARSCGACHFKDGRGAPPLSSTEAPVALLFRLSRPTEIEWETKPDENYGGQFNHLSILGIESEGSVEVWYQEISEKYDDGSSYSLRKPIYQFKNLKYGDFASDMLISPRIAPHMVGLGLLEAISEETILALADPNDHNNDGISGKPNYVWDLVNNKESLGRFGWKCNQPSVRQQVAGAFNGDIGITSSLFPIEGCAENQQACKNVPIDSKPELDERILDRVTLYSSSLAVPKRRDWDKPEVLKGKGLFHELKCEACHTPKYLTSTHPDFPEFASQTIYPYSDLLLHDMGDGLADGRPDGLANGNEWRTPPLWGIGLIPIVNRHTFLLHDGRARNVEEAILWHGGEAEASKIKFVSLNNEKRQAVIAFVNSL